MLRQSSCILTLIAGLVSCAAGDVVYLKGNAAIAGKIMAEKPDQLVVDIGYTVLVIPRDQVVKVETETGAPAGLTNASIPSPGQSDKGAAPPRESTPVASNETLPRHSVFSDGDNSGPDRSVRELVSLLGEAVVQVRTPSGLGSGFIINDEGYLITNFHVIESETQISVEVYHQKQGQLDRRSYRQIRILAINKYADLALLKIEDKDAPKFSVVRLGDSDALGVGERVFAIGSPLGLERTVTEGIVSTKTRPLQGELYLQTTTQINPGNSGGPLFNLRGEVIGVTNMKITFGEGLGFAIPVDTVRFFLNHRDAFNYDTDNPSSPYRYLEPPNRISKSLAPP